MNLDLEEKNMSRRKFYLLAFLTPLLFVFMFAIIRRLAPFGKYNLMAIDAWGQYFPMLCEMKNAWRGGSLLYSFSGALGFDLVAQSAYYSASPLWLLLYILPGDIMPWQVDTVIFLRFALAGLSFSYYLSEKFGRKDFSLVVFGCVYAFSGYTLAFINQIMWMDAVVLLPLVCLGIERLVNGKKGGLYLISLFTLILSNFYIGYAVCIFSVLWFLLASAVNTKKIKAFLLSCVRFAFCSLAAGLLNLPMLLRVYKAVGNTLASDMGFPDKITADFSAGEFLIRLLPFNKASLQYGAPNIYFGAVCLVLMLSALFSKKISLRKKISYTALIVFLVLSFNINILNFIWHGFHFPNQLPGRQSFVFIFTCLVCAFGGYIFLSEQWKNKKITSEILISLVLVEMVLNSAVVFSSDIRTTSKSSLLAHREAFHILSEEFTPDRKDNEFWRCERIPHRYNGGQLYGYYGISHYSSTMSADCYNFFQNLGMERYARNVSTEYVPNPVLNALFGIRYIINEKNQGDEVSVFVKQADDMYIYENTAALPLAYVCSEDILSVDTEKRGYALADEIFSKASGTENVLSPRGELDREEFMRGIEKLKKGSLEITEFTRRYIEGSFTAEEKGVLMISLPAKDVKIIIDGQEENVLTVAGYMAGASVTPGSHNVRIYFG